MPQRPSHFTLNASAPLANSLAFAGLAPGGLVGSTLYPDSSLHELSGTGTPAAGWRFASEIGRWYVYFGNDELVTLSSVAAGWSNNVFGIFFWAKPDNVSNDQYVMMGNDTNNRAIILGYQDGYWNAYNLPIGYPAGGSHPEYTSVTATAAVWQHIGFTSDGVTFKGYRNGVEEKSYSTSNFNVYETITKYEIGCPLADKRFNGGLTDIMVYGGCLPSPAEIQQLADPSNVLLSGLILPPRRKWWPAVSGAPPAENYLLLHLCNKHGNKIGGGLGGKQCG